MKHSRIPLLSCLCIVVVASFLLRATTTSANSVAACGKWNLVPDSLPGYSQWLSSVAGSSSNDVWAIGYNQPKRNKPLIEALIQHWNGAQWSAVTPPHVNSQSSQLNAVAVVSSSDAWAVGNLTDKQTSNSLSLIEHWDGASWSVVSSPNPGAVASLSGVTAISANDIWAVGYVQVNNSSLNQTLTEHWDGNSWSVVSSPNVSGADNGLVSVSAIATNDVWAVGATSNPQGNPVMTLIEHWNGTSWSIINSPQPSNYENLLVGVTAISPSDAWAVGWYHPNSNSGNYTLTEHWDGAQWSIVSSPNPTKNGSQLYAVTAVSTNDVWAVGGHARGTLTMQWNGTAWSIVSSPNPKKLTGTPWLNSVSALPNNQGIWTVGAYYVKRATKGITENYC